MPDQQTPPPDEQQTVEYWQGKADEYLNNWKRAVADFDNYRKRRGREDEELISFARQATVIKILPSLEALSQALRHVPDGEAHAQWASGIAGIRAQLDRALSELGVERIKTDGETFNHELHEAVEMVEGRGEAGKIVETIADGYTINGLVVRPAKVKVAK